MTLTFFGKIIARLKTQPTISNIFRASHVVREIVGKIGHLSTKLTGGEDKVLFLVLVTGLQKQNTLPAELIFGTLCL
jgi:hypothetical protein